MKNNFQHWLVPNTFHRTTSSLCHSCISDISLSLHYLNGFPGMDSNTFGTTTTIAKEESHGTGQSATTKLEKKKSATFVDSHRFNILYLSNTAKPSLLNKKKKHLVSQTIQMRATIRWLASLIPRLLWDWKSHRTRTGQQFDSD